MIHAAHPVFLDAAVNHIDTLVRAVTPDQRRLSAIAAKQNQFLAEQGHRQRFVGSQFFGQRHRLPIAPHQHAAWRSRSGLDQQMIFFSSNHSLSSTFAGRILAALLTFSRSIANDPHLQST